ncbi:MAG: NUDIX domain-containing protein [Anaerolineae bacterium]
MTGLIECRTLFNKTILVPVESLIQRPSVYGIVLHQRQLLVARARSTQKYVLPGGGIEKGEAVDAALRREVWEETGVQVEVGEFLHFQTDLFYYDPLDLALHGFLFFYAARPLTTALDPPEYPPEEDVDFPLWVSIDHLTADAFQAHGATIMRLIVSRHAHES